MNTNNNVNKEKNVNNVNKEILMSAFEEFWTAYPRKIDKKKAADKFKIAAKKHGTEIIIRGAESYAAECRLTGIDKQYIKHATTFLNAESFKNEFDLTPQREGGKIDEKTRAAREYAEKNELPF